MAWYYHLNGANHGPVEAPELQALLQRQAISLDTLVWSEGMAQWIPYHNSTAIAGLAGIGATHACAECGKRFAEDEMLHYENSWVCANCKPIFFQRVKEGVTPVGKMVYSGVFRRFVALVVDGIVMDIFVLVPLFLVVGWHDMTHEGDSTAGENVLVILMEYGFPALYDMFFVGQFGATPGKMLLGIKIVTADGGRVSYLRALGRHFAEFLSAIILGIGYLIAIWDDEKRTLHDRICNTRVIMRNSQ